MSISSVSSVDTGFYWSNGLPRLSDEQRIAQRNALIAQCKPVSEEDLPESWKVSSGYTSPGKDKAPETTVLSGANDASVAVTRHPAEGATSPSYTLRLGGEDSQLNVEFGGNLRIAKGEDGLYSVYFSDSNVTRTYAEDGSFTEISGDTTDADGSRIFVSTTPGETMQGGSGNDTFLVYGSCSHINTGEGDNTVILKNASSLARSDPSLTTGDGNNTITVEGAFSGTMSLGNGDNTVSIGTLTGTLSLGDGRNHVTIDSMNKGFGGALASISTGNGDSHFSIKKMGNGASISNLFTTSSESSVAESARRTFAIGSMSDQASISLHSGTNSLDIGSMQDGASVSQLFGDMNLNIQQMSGYAKAFCLSDRTSVTVRNMSGDTQLSVAGQSSVQIEEMAGSANVSVSDRPGGFLLLDPETGQLAGYESRPAEVYIGTMKDSTALSLIGSGHTAAIASIQDDALIDSLNSSADSGTNIIIANADDASSFPAENVTVHILSELTQEQLESVEALLVEWRREREEAGLPATKQDLWASLNGEVSAEEEMAQRIALLLSWN